MTSCGAKGCDREMIWDEDAEVDWCREHGTHEDVMNACEDCETCPNPNCLNGYVPYGPSYNGTRAEKICHDCMGSSFIPCDYHC